MGQGHGRIHFMDSMRAILMMLGIVLHSAQVFNPAYGWLIHSDTTTPIARWLVESVTLFRMPAFFIVAGFFCVLSLRKHGVHQFAVVRIERIIIPLLAGAILLNSLQTLLLTGFGRIEFDLYAYLADGQWASHLWFLIHLAVYFVGAWLVTRQRWSAPTVIGQRMAGAFSAMPPLALLALVAGGHLVAMKVASSTGALDHGIVLGLFDVYSLMNHLPYFVFGLLLALNRELLYRFIGVRPALAVVVIAASVGVAEAGLGEGWVARVGADYFALLAGWAAAALCFSLFHRYANRQSALAAYLSSASYTVYLFHHLLVVAFAMILIEFDVGGVAGIAVLVVSVSTAALWIHRNLVSRSAYARFLFNGVRSQSAGVLPVGLARPRP